jgi:hypothetical protein
MKMPFGKYEGYDVREIPRNYLDWCLNNIGDLSPRLREAMEDALAGRSRSARQRSPIKVIEKVRDQFRTAVKTWYRHASRKHHPDHGGSNERMAVINEARDELLEAVESLEVRP